MHLSPPLILGILATLSITLAIPKPGRYNAELPTNMRYVDKSFSLQVRDTIYQGDGSVHAGWPAINKWLPFDQLWRQNKNSMYKSCVLNGWGANNSPEELKNLRKAIFQAVDEDGFSPLEANHRRSFYLAVVLQESGGCVPTTNNGVRNPGLMQDHNGRGTCNENKIIREPCPKHTINLMIQEGTQGTPFGDGLEQLIAKARGMGAPDAQAYYMAARLYSSGSIPADQNLSGGIGSTDSYASDIANRLTGAIWNESTSY
ncbi:hypothetical protein B7494_g7603 [Chlorociboria aeruginascens]|nr:hypothetical protein B7494_g7603 [Chlorociboria aeruginascens]